jgi:hypothetical protein
MNAIEALIQRMDQAPEEFADDATWRGTRWEHITDIMFSESKSYAKPRVFTQEEVDTYMNKLGTIVRKQVEEQVCVELLNPLRVDTARQLDLFPAASGYPPKGLLTSAQMQNDALRILQDEMDKHKQVYRDVAKSFADDIQEQQVQKQEAERLHKQLEQIQDHAKIVV